MPVQNEVWNEICEKVLYYILEGNLTYVNSSLLDLLIGILSLTTQKKYVNLPYIIASYNRFKCFTSLSRTKPKIVTPFLVTTDEELYVGFATTLLAHVQNRNFERVVSTLIQN